MKGYCKCGKVIDEVQFSQFGMCNGCIDKCEVLMCKTCGENPAVNGFYGECEGCIEKFMIQEAMNDLGEI